MDLELLRTFLELNRNRHFGRSAEALHITQAAVSTRLKTLEAQLGVTLFERGRGQMRLTPEGTRLVRHARRLIAGWRAARQDVAHGGAEGQLVVGGSVRLWDVLLQRWLHDLRRAWPRMAIIVESQAPDVLTRHLIDGALDVAVMLEPAQLEILQNRRIAAIKLELVSSKSNQTLEDALGRDYVMVDWGLSFALDHRRAFPDIAESITRVSHARIALDYISSVGGSAYLPRRMVAREIEFGLLFPVENAPVFERQVYATFPLQSSRAKLIDQCLGLIGTG